MIAFNFCRLSCREGEVKCEMSKCPKCEAEYVEVEVDFEYGDVILRKVKALRCPVCKEELFTPEQYSVIRARIHRAAQPLRLKRKISTRERSL
jgi:YgiT-type zinc finger domain-containing protein